MLIQAKSGVNPKIPYIPDLGTFLRDRTGKDSPGEKVRLQIV